MTPLPLTFGLGGQIRHDKCQDESQGGWDGFLKHVLEPPLLLNFDTTSVVMFLVLLSGGRCRGLLQVPPTTTLCITGCT